MSFETGERSVPSSFGGPGVIGSVNGDGICEMGVDVEETLKVVDPNGSS